MIKKTLTFLGLEDEDGNQAEYTEDFYFGIQSAEIKKMAITEGDGLDVRIARLFRTNNRKAIYEYIEDFIKLAYGVKHEDGKRFIQNQEVWEAFRYSDAYSALIDDITETEYGILEFVNGIMPQSYIKQMEKAKIEQPEKYAEAEAKIQRATGQAV